MKLARSLSIIARMVDGLLLALVATVVTCAALATISPRIGHPVLAIRGGSMEPAIPLGSLVIVDEGPPADLRIGDIVSFRADNGTSITHRVARLATVAGSAYFASKGDANTTADPQITPVSAVIGRVVWVVPVAGYLLVALATPVGFLAVLLSAATLLVLALLLEELAIERRARAIQPARGLRTGGALPGPVPGAARPDPRSG